MTSFVAAKHCQSERSYTVNKTYYFSSVPCVTCHFENSFYPNFFFSVVMSILAYLLVVQPIPADGPPIVAKVILYGWICHLERQKCQKHLQYRLLWMLPTSSGERKC